MEEIHSVFQREEAYWTALEEWRASLAGSADRAGTGWEAVEAAVLRSAEAGLFLPLPYVQAAFSLTELQTQAMALTLLAEREPDGEELTLTRAAEQLSSEWDPNLVRSQLTQTGTGWLLCLEAVPQRGSDRLVPSARILDFVLNGHFDQPQTPGMGLKQPETLVSAEPLKKLAERMKQLSERSTAKRITFLLTGPTGSGRKTLAGMFAGELGVPLLTADGRRLTERGAGAFRRDLLREAVLQRCPVLLTGLEAELESSAGDPELARALTELISELAAASGISILLGETDWQPEEPPADWLLMPIELPQPGLLESAALWDRLLESHAQEKTLSGDRLAGKYRLTPGQIKNALADAEALAIWENDGVLTPGLLERGCRRQLRHRLGDKARRVETVFTWEDLILPDGAKRLLRSACEQVRFRARVYEDWEFGHKLSYGGGLSLLFSGPPGTGKTMAAQVAAGELGLELYKVELPAIVSKYVGETEKNLRDIFREAARSQAILFFDEADVLFAKRTEMKEAQDKYSNMEAAYLLQKMEEYPGISILATNFLQNFDEAFKRRLKFIIDFPFPNAEYRLQLWKTVFPGKTPVDRDVDFEFLAQQFELSGSAIKNTAVNAAFLAAGEQTEVNMRHLLIALRRELQKSGKSLSRQDFGPYYMLVEEESHGSI